VKARSVIQLSRHVVGRRLGSALGAAALAAVALSGCGAAVTSGSSAAAVSDPSLATSLATSAETSAGTWAVVPMGHLDQPLNTFWQLFFRPSGGSRWSDFASDLAVATNGGILLATQNGRSLLVGVRPANLLDFSPLLVTPNAGRTWVAATPVAALAGHPNALAIEAGGHALALVRARNSSEILTSQDRLSTWEKSTTAAVIGSSSAGRSCRLVALSAVGYAAGKELVGASCRRPGVVGVFAISRGEWKLAGPSLPPAVGSGTVSVLGLVRTSRGLCAVLDESSAHGVVLIAAWTEGPDSRWRVSRGLTLASATRAVSFGTDGAMGLFVLSSGPKGTESLRSLTGPGVAWNALPAPPPNTSTLAFGPAGRVDALATKGTSFTDWRLDGGSGRWTKLQVVNVAIQYGSSG